MKNIYTYDISLNNDDCIFDSRDGFSSLDEAVAWASGRGGTYSITIVKQQNGKDVEHAHLSADDTGAVTKFFADLYGFWEEVNVEQIADCFFLMHPDYI